MTTRKDEPLTEEELNAIDKTFEDPKMALHITAYKAIKKLLAEVRRLNAELDDCWSKRRLYFRERNEEKDKRIAELESELKSTELMLHACNAGDAIVYRERGAAAERAAVVAFIEGACGGSPCRPCCCQEVIEGVLAGEHLPKKAEGK